MVSGPDLGGGFLFQLTRSREAGGVRYIFHAQDWGSDAGGPPKGSPEPIGYRHPSSYCGFGGPRCWHREFRLETDSPTRVRSAYNRSRFVMEAMVGPAGAGGPDAVDQAIVEIVGRLSGDDPADRPIWCIGGSAALRLRGFDVVPADIDLATDARGVERIATRLEEYLIEPAASTTWPEERALLAARAFVGSFRAGARTEWAAAEPPSPIDLSLAALARREIVEWKGTQIPVAPLDMLASRVWNRLGGDGWKTYVEQLSRASPDRSLIRAAAKDRTLPEAQASELRALSAE
ncbi:MAG TPA: hypothetical protein VFF67_05465 [Thermoplasmata archaeon]|nr:hypothetical protein [Thermoplasmata archaeon]